MGVKSDSLPLKSDSGSVVGPTFIFLLLGVGGAAAFAVRLLGLLPAGRWRYSGAVSSELEMMPVLTAIFLFRVATVGVWAAGRSSMFGLSTAVVGSTSVMFSVRLTALDILFLDLIGAPARWLEAEGGEGAFAEVGRGAGCVDLEYVADAFALALF